MLKNVSWPSSVPVSIVYLNVQNHFRNTLLFWVVSFSHAFVGEGVRELAGERQEEADTFRNCILFLLLNISALHILSSLFS